jgi:3-oxoacyl-[acyl-carrier-protein] synthase III
MEDEYMPARPETPDNRRGVAVVGIGGYRPRRVVDNDTVAARVGRDAEWILRRTGIRRRHHAGPDEQVADMAVEAATKALAEAGVAGRELGAVIVASMSETRRSPGAAPEVAYRLGAACGAFDLNAACAGFCYGLDVAASLVTARGRAVVVIGVDRMTEIIDPADPGTAPLFADGAGAMVVAPGEPGAIGPTVSGSDGGGRDLIAHTATWREYREVPGTPWPTMGMAGPPVFRWVLDTMPEVARRAAAAAGSDVADLEAFVPHQANLRIVDGLAARLDLPASTVVGRDVVTSGNTSSASIPLAVDRLRELGAVRPGDRALLLGFGGGLTWAGQVIRLP